MVSVSSSLLNTKHNAHTRQVGMLYSQSWTQAITTASGTATVRKSVYAGKQVWRKRVHSCITAAAYKLVSE